MAAAPTSGNEANSLPSAFMDSITRDMDGVRNIPRGLDSPTVREFLDVIEQCEGQILLSGIGENT